MVIASGFLNRHFKKFTLKKVFFSTFLVIAFLVKNRKKSDILCVVTNFI